MFELGITPRALAAVKYGDEFGRIMAARLWLRYFAMVEVGDNVTGKNDIEKLPKGMIRLLYSGWCKGGDPRDMVSMAVDGDVLQAPQADQADTCGFDGW